MTLSQIPEVRGVALAGRFAIIGGWPAWALGRILREYPGGLEGLLDRSNVPAELREDVIRGVSRSILQSLGISVGRMERRCTRGRRAHRAD